MEVLTRLCDIRRSRGRFVRNLACGFPLKVVILSLSDLFPDDINVVREVNFLNEFDEESWKQRKYDGQRRYCPEGCLCKDLYGSFIELIGAQERRVNSSPEPDEQDTNDHKKAHKPVPSIGVEQDVGIDADDGSNSNIDTESLSVIDIQAIASDRLTRNEQQVSHKEADD